MSCDETVPSIQGARVECMRVGVYRADIKVGGQQWSNCGIFESGQTEGGLYLIVYKEPNGKLTPNLSKLWPYELKFRSKDSQIGVLGLAKKEITCWKISSSWSLVIFPKITLPNHRLLPNWYIHTLKVPEMILYPRILEWYFPQPCSCCRDSRALFFLTAQFLYQNCKQSGDTEIFERVPGSRGSLPGDLQDRTLCSADLAGWSQGHGSGHRRNLEIPCSCKVVRVLLTSLVLGWSSLELVAKRVYFYSIQNQEGLVKGHVLYVFLVIGNLERRSDIGSFCWLTHFLLSTSQGGLFSDWGREGPILL